MTRARASGGGRRRGSVLVLVMTLLGVLFVTGIVFLTTVDFEAQIIATDRERDRNRDGIRAVVADLGSVLHDSLMAAPDVPFGGRAVGESLGGFAELPGVQNLIASVEPHRTGDNRVVFGEVTDVVSIRGGPHDGSGWRRLRNYKDGNDYPFVGIDTSWPSGVPVELVNPDDASDRVMIYPMDADGDGIVDTLGSYPVDADGDGTIDAEEAEDLLDLEDLGFSEAQIESLSRQVNPTSNPTGKVFLGLRVIAHGGMVNLNASHPTLLAYALNLWKNDKPWVDALQDVDGSHPELGYFRHQPTRDQVPYSPFLEEAMLRRRMVLPPQSIAPSLLHGNSLLGGRGGPYGQAHLSRTLYPPDPDDRFGGAASGTDFERVYEGSHRYWPFAPDEAYSGNIQLWAARMEPFTALATDDLRVYDRRHLVTTVSHDDLLSRGGRWKVRDYTGNVLDDQDLLGKMREANRTADVPGSCPDKLNRQEPLPFEYAAYPQDGIPDGTVPNRQDVKCECPTQDICRFDPRKGRLSLSLAWLDDALERVGIDADPENRVITADQQERLIHDAFMMLVRNARGPYWDIDMLCVDDTDCEIDDGEFCDKERANWVCVDGLSLQSRREALISRTAASLTANMLSYAYDNRMCKGGLNDGQLCVSDVECSRDFRIHSDVDGVCYPLRECWDDSLQQFTNRWCLIDSECGTGESCHARRDCAGGSRNGMGCASDGDCPDGGYCRDRDTGKPTRVALRSFDFRNPKAAGRRLGWVCDEFTDSEYRGMPCDGDGYCPGGLCEPVKKCTANSARPLERCEVDMECPGGECRAVYQYVYGLERQPFITEVATAFDDVGAPVAWAVELFNPYDKDIDWDADGDGQVDYRLVEMDASGNKFPTQLRRTLRAGEFTVFKTGPDGAFAGVAEGPAAHGRVYNVSGELRFTQDWVVFLVRRATYAEEQSTVTVDIVVDQIWLDTLFTDSVGVITPPDLGGTYPGDVSVQRAVPLSSPWKAPVPRVPVDVPGNTLGNWNADDSTVLPVEVNFANAGRFSLDPDDPSKLAAFPTTGSMLLLMRHANRSLSDYSSQTDKVEAAYTRSLAFTTWLDETTKVYEGTALQAVVHEDQQIDNGRMPVFDLGKEVTDSFGVKILDAHAHHIHPAAGACCLDRCYENWLRSPCEENGGDFWPGAECSAELCVQGLRAVPPGQVRNLPWGQLVFDYFTALPLSNDGPYTDKNNPIDPASLPRVDMEGLRVHGRVNINAAPWTALSGLPLIPMEKIPGPFRDRFRETLGLSGRYEDYEAANLGEFRAWAIVAYREAREVTDDPTGNNQTLWTGDYGELRGWDLLGPVMRRGMGFLTVGELANVRHDNRSDPLSRIDSDVLHPANPTAPDYVRAVALLASLGDWVTVRSQVFTIYGVLRGELDADMLGEQPKDEDWERAAADVDTRAIRFQETVDRLPVFMGDSAPARIGQRTVGKYIDVRND